MMFLMYNYVRKNRIKPCGFVLRIKLHDTAFSYWKDEYVSVYYNFYLRA